MNDLDLWAFDGSFAIKSLDDSGRFEGLAVPFGDHDLSPMRDRFEAETDFGRAMKSGADLLYHHGLAKVRDDPNPLTDAILGDAEFKMTDEGVWVTGQITLNDKYVEGVKGMVKAGKLGLSTGTAAHRVRREKNADGTHTIKSWPIVEVSLTPTPAHPRTSVYALKTLMQAEEPPESAGLVDTLKRAESALEWATSQPDLNVAKRDAIKSLTESVRRFRDSQVDPAKVKADIERITRLKARVKGYKP